MNIRKIIIASFLIGGFCSHTYGQYLYDVLRFSQPEQGSTARFKAMGNAQNALGGDISSISGNPAGLGFFNQSDFSLSLDYVNDVNKSTYFGTNSQNYMDKIGFNQIGGVFHIPTRKSRGSDLSSGWLNFNIGIGYSKTNNFHSTLGYTGINPDNSIADFMAYEDIGRVYNDFGWESGMIDEHANGYDIAMTMLNNRQTAYSRESGTQAQTNISFGANYSNQLYIGASLGFSRINHRMNSTFMEDGSLEDYGYIYSQNPSSRFVDPGNGDYNTYNPLLQSDYEYDDEYWSSTTGNGFNAKLGIIYKPISQLQIGLSATTPTWYRLTNDYTDYFGITNYLLDGSTESFEFPQEDTYYNYDLRTPYLLNGGLAVIFSQGLISADVEYVDYTSMRFSSPNAGTDNDMNTSIRDTYKSTVNFRVGGEYVFAPSFLVRAGYNYNGGPYADFDSNIQVVSAGLGYRVNNIYIDLTYQNLSQQYSINPYIVDESISGPAPVVDVNNTRNSVLLTLGAKF